MRQRQCGYGALRGGREGNQSVVMRLWGIGEGYRWCMDDGTQLWGTGDRAM